MLREISSLRLSAVLCALAAAGAARAQTVTTGPSAHCHMVDGQFSNCPDGTAEWSDILSLQFQLAFDPSQPVVVYTDTGSGAIQLMYSLTYLTTPYGPNDPDTTIHFDTRDATSGLFEQYDVVIHGNNTFNVLLNGAPDATNEGITAQVGFGTTPGDPTSTPHVLIELSVPLNVVYSPDVALFWSSSAPISTTGGRGGGGSAAPIIRAVRKASDPGTTPTSNTLVYTNGRTGQVTVTALPLGTAPGNTTPADLCKLAAPLLVSLLKPTAEICEHRNRLLSDARKIAKNLIKGLKAEGFNTKGLQRCLIKEVKCSCLPFEHDDEDDDERGGERDGDHGHDH
jgi:hypothetical protein